MASWEIVRLLSPGVSSLTTPLALKVRESVSSCSDNEKDSEVELTQVEISSPKSTALIKSPGTFIRAKDSAEVGRGRSRRYWKRFGQGKPRKNSWPYWCCAQPIASDRPSAQPHSSSR